MQNGGRLVPKMLSVMAGLLPCLQITTTTTIIIIIIIVIIIIIITIIIRTIAVISWHQEFLLCSQLHGARK